MDGPAWIFAVAIAFNALLWTIFDSISLLKPLDKDNVEDDNEVVANLWDGEFAVDAIRYTFLLPEEKEREWLEREKARADLPTGPVRLNMLSSFLTFLNSSQKIFTGKFSKKQLITEAG